MTKAELIASISDESDIQTSVVDKVLDGLAHTASKALGEGGEVTIPGLVKLNTKQRAARKGRNPATGEALDIPAKTVVTTKVLKGLADHVA